MGLYLLNISVDTSDAYPAYIAEDLSINDQESIVELVVETFLGYGNVIKEYDDPDSQDHNKRSNIKPDLHAQIGTEVGKMNVSTSIKGQKTGRLNAYLSGGFYQLDSPPPKV